VCLRDHDKKEFVMASVLNESFIRSVTKRVDDCSNPLQLREYLKRYQSYVFTPDIQKVFVERIRFFKQAFCGDGLQIAICDELQELLETEIKIANVIRNENHLMSCYAEDNHEKKVRAIENNINLLYIQDDCETHCDKEMELLRQVFQMTNGNKVDICRILDMDNQFLNDKIEQYKLKDELNDIRREFRNSCKR
jgi:hypothetical protein